MSAPGKSTGPSNQASDPKGPGSTGQKVKMPRLGDYQNPQEARDNQAGHGIAQTTVNQIPAASFQDVLNDRNMESHWLKKQEHGTIHPSTQEEIKSHGGISQWSHAWKRQDKESWHDYLRRHGMGREE
ncbi:MAG: hypothetical protein Q9159_000648 [Coniocarpon cinnabarinum]